MPAKDVSRALALAERGKLPNLLNFTVRRAAALNTAEAFAAITAALARAADDAHRLDTLTGLNFALKGERKAPMPKVWEQIEAKLLASPNWVFRPQAPPLTL